uniref:Uncharacterized protein n=1 Tax=Acrobeloides nanus TaxID=290746 RepID=A0A914D9J5_9BILA
MAGAVGAAIEVIVHMMTGGVIDHGECEAGVVYSNGLVNPMNLNFLFMHLNHTKDIWCLYFCNYGIAGGWG